MAWWRTLSTAKIGLFDHLMVGRKAGWLTSDLSEVYGPEEFGPPRTLLFNMLEKDEND